MLSTDFDIVTKAQGQLFDVLENNRAEFSSTDSWFIALTERATYAVWRWRFECADVSFALEAALLDAAAVALALPDHQDEVANLALTGVNQLDGRPLGMSEAGAPDPDGTLALLPVVNILAQEMESTGPDGQVPNTPALIDYAAKLVVQFVQLLVVQGELHR